jgi:TolB protein
MIQSLSGLRLWILLFLLCLPLFAAAQKVIEGPVIIGGQEKPRMLILKPEAKSVITEQEQVIQELYDLLIFDLQFSDVFTVSPETPQANYVRRQDKTSGTVNFIDWKRILIQEKPLDYLVQTELVPRGPGLYELDLLVYDIQQAQRVIGTAYGAEPHAPFTKKLLRAAGHQATADIIKALTNGDEKPITQTQIAFINYNTTKRQKELFLIDYDGWKDSIVQLTFFNSTTLFPAWSPDGAKLAYVSYKEQWPDAFIQNVASGRVTTLARFRGTNTTPTWFPNSEELAISLSVEGNPEIYRIKPGDKNPKRLTFDQGIDVAPAVSPTGNQIAFISDRIGSPKLYIMDTDGANVNRIYHGDRKNDTPQWSPKPIGDDYLIAFAGYYSSLNSDIFITRPDGTGLEMLTDERGDNQNPSWSPNGRYVAFSSNRSGKTEIYIMSCIPGKLLPNGERFHRITTMPGENLSPAWSPN